MGQWTRTSSAATIATRPAPPSRVEARAERAKLVRAWRAQRALVAQAHSAKTALRPFPNRPLTVGFYLSTDELGYPDLKRVVSNLDWFVPAWMNLDGPELKLVHSVDKRAISAIALERSVEWTGNGRSSR